MIKISKKIILLLITNISTLTVYFLLPDACPEAGKRTAAIFVIAALFWAFEIIPLYATSIFVVILLILSLSIFSNSIGPNKSNYQTFLLPFSSPVIILLFSSFVLAQAVRKYEIDKIILSRLLKIFGNKPICILYGFMITTAILSMWLSNTATTSMMIAMIFPLLSKLDPDDNFKKAIVLGIAFGANIGGIGTPIGTPPNAIALGILRDHGYNIDFLTWMKLAVPLVFLLLLSTGIILYLMFYPKYKMVRFDIPGIINLNNKGKLTIAILLLTILLWLTSPIHQIPESIIGLVAVGLLAGIQIINNEDLKKIEWDILVLIWGGLALGKGIEVSGLANWIFQLPLFEYQGTALVAIFCILGILMSMTISNTATASLLLPIAINLPIENHLFLVITVTISSSLAMALPISTPSNAIAFATKSITSKDMLKSGIIVCLLSIFVILIGYKLVLSKVLSLN